MNKTIIEMIETINKQLDDVEMELEIIKKIPSDTEVYVTEKLTEKTFEVSSKEDAREMYKIGCKLDDLRDRLLCIKHDVAKSMEDYMNLSQRYITEIRAYMEQI